MRSLCDSLERTKDELLKRLENKTECEKVKSLQLSLNEKLREISTL